MNVVVLQICSSISFCIVHVETQILFIWNEVCDYTIKQYNVTLTNNQYCIQPNQQQLEYIDRVHNTSCYPSIKLIECGDLIYVLHYHNQHELASNIQLATTLYAQPNSVLLHQLIHELCTGHTYPYDHTHIATRCKIGIRKMNQWYYSLSHNSMNNRLTNAELHGNWQTS